MSTESPPSALLLVAPGCPHCPTVLQGLSELVKEGVVGHLEVFNVAAHPEKAAELGVRGVPWLRLGGFELTGLRSEAELRELAGRAASDEGAADYLVDRLSEGELAEAERFLGASPGALGPLLARLAGELPMQVKIGVGALVEGLAGSEPLAARVPALAELSRADSPALRADACHFLGLTGNPAAVEPLRERLEDEDPEVREIAAESLEALGESR